MTHKSYLKTKVKLGVREMLHRHIRVAAIRAVRRLTTASEEAETVALANLNESTTGSSPSTGGGGRDTLGRRLFALVHPKRSAVVAITKWKEEGNVVRKYELNRLVRELRKLKRYKHALETCEWMRRQEDIKLLPGDYAVHLDLIAKLRGLDSAEKFFEDLPEEMRRAPTLSALLHTYVQHRAYSEAEAMMQKMIECGYVDCPLPYNHMISMYLQNGQLDKIPGIIKELQKNTTPDLVTYNLWLTMCQSQDDIETAEKVFLETRNAKIEPDWITFSILTSLYTKKDVKDKAESALKEMEKRITRKNRGAYSSLISLNTNLGLKNGVNGIWRKMKALFRQLNDSEYSCMISSLIKLGEVEEAEKFYGEWESVSTTGDSRIPNLLIGAYIKKGQMGKAKRFYDRIVHKGIKPSYTTWELLTWGYLKEKQTDQMLDCFEKAVSSVRRKWEPDEKIVREMFGLLEEQGNTDGAEKLLSVLRNAGFVTTELYNMVLRTYAKAEKMPPIIEERMAKDKVVSDEETKELIRATSRMCVADVSTCLA